MMSRIIVERRFDTPLAVDGLPFPGLPQCLSLRGIAWQSSVISSDRRYALLTCTAPDMESLRIGLHRESSHMQLLFAFEEFAFLPGASATTLVQLALSGHEERRQITESALRGEMPELVRAWFSRDSMHALLLTRGMLRSPAGRLMSVHCDIEVVSSADRGITLPT